MQYRPRRGQLRYVSVLVTRKWHADGTTAAGRVGRSAQQRSDQDFFGGDDGTRTHDFLLAKQVL